jgi:hypothetical protein
MLSVYEDIKNNKEDNYKSVYKKLLKSYDKIELDFVRYIHSDTEEKEVRKDQHSFRKELVKRYRQCIITQTDEQICEACHIIPFAECTDSDKYNTNNGLLLRSDLHKLFDSKKLKINPKTLIIEIADEILKNKKMKTYVKYVGEIIKVHAKSIPYLKKIYKKN